MSPILLINENRGFFKVDFANYSNRISRDKALNKVKSKVPTLYPFLHQCYKEPSNLFFGVDIILSETGKETGPLLF